MTFSITKQVTILEGWGKYVGNRYSVNHNILEVQL